MNLNAGRYQSGHSGRVRSEEQDHDAAVVATLRKRDGVPTIVCLHDARELTVLNIAWGYDDGDDSAHITTNISPGDPSRAVDFFLTSEVRAIEDPQDRGCNLLAAT